MYQYNNPINAIYLQNKQWYQPQQTQIMSRYVSNIEEAKATIIAPLSVNIFIDIASGKIYMKKMNNNGLAEFYEYIIADTKEETSFEQIENRLKNIEEIIGGVINDKSVSSNDKQHATTAITEQNESDDETKSAGFSKNARNDKWQKRN